MADQYTVSKKSGGAMDSFMNSYGALIIGIILIIAGLITFWVNESRIDMSKVAKKSIEVSASKADKTYDGELVSVTGNIVTPSYATDPQYLSQGDYLLLERKVEMYSWDEHTTSSSTETKYTYSNIWTENPKNSLNFKVRFGHENTFMQVRSETFRAAAAKIGVYFINLVNITMPSPQEIKLTSSNTILGGYKKLDGNYIYIGIGNLYNSQVGDLRISYKAVANDSEFTVFGKQSGDSIGPYEYKNEKLFRTVKGAREQAIAQLASEYTTGLWMGRIIAIVLFCLGVFLLVKKVAKKKA